MGVEHQRTRTYLFLLELGVAAGKLVVDVARQVLEPACRQRRELLSSLIALRVEVVAYGEEGDWSRMRAGVGKRWCLLTFIVSGVVLSTDKLIIDVCR